MSLTFAVLGTLALILPALAAILMWNMRAKRFVSARPDLPITAMSVLTIATAMTLFINVMTWCFFVSFQAFAENLQPILPCTRYPNLCLPLLNPTELLAAFIQNGANATPAEPMHLAYIAGMILAQTVFTVSMISNEGFDLAFADLDLSRLGWAHEFVWMPSKHGYLPIASVLTSIEHDGLAVGYRGLVNDLRSNEHGETMSISLSAPYRFLYEIKAGQTKAGAKTKATPQFIRYPGEQGPAAVALSANVILNIEIENSETALMKMLPD